MTLVKRKERECKEMPLRPDLDKRAEAECILQWLDFLTLLTKSAFQFIGHIDVKKIKDER